MPPAKLYLRVNNYATNKDLSTSSIQHDTALNWFRLYLKGRQQTVLHWLKNLTTQWAEVWCPAWLCAWAIPVHSIHFPTGGVYPSTSPPHSLVCRWHRIYITFKTSLVTQGKASVRAIEALSVLRTWMIQNRLKLNENKTEFLVITSPRLHSKLTFNNITMGESINHLNTKARNLDATFDHHMDIEAHVTVWPKLAMNTWVRSAMSSPPHHHLPGQWDLGNIWAAWPPTLQAPAKRCVFRCFLKVATEVVEWTDSGRLFQRDRAQECWSWP